jgi:hypothetical protein
MEHDFMKRGHLLPERCKDLIDVLEKPEKPSQQAVLFLRKLKKPLPFKFKPITPFWKASAYCCVQATPDYALLFILAQAPGAPDAER